MTLLKKRSHCNLEQVEKNRLMTKHGITQNHKFVLLDQSTKHFHLLKDEEEVKRWVEDGSIGEDDIVIEIKPENVRLAIKHNFIELK